jgi:flagellin
MAIAINNNASLFSARFLNNTQNNLQTAQERLSSGKRINRAQDDAAGLAIAARLATQLLGSQQAYDNAYNAISLAQTAEGSMSELQNITQRIRELSIQASNGTLNNSQREFLQLEVSSLQEEAANIIDTAEFNGKKLLSSDANIEIQVGNGADDRMTIETNDLRAALTNSGFFSVDISTANGAQTALNALDASMDPLLEQRSNFGAITNRLESVGRSLEVEAESIAASKSRIEDADYASEIASRTNSLILQNAGLASIAQGNVSSQLAAQLLK